MEKGMPLKWGIIGTGQIASDFCIALTSLPKTDHQIVAVASRSFTTAEKFASKFNITKFYGNYVDLYADTNIDVVYIGTVTSNHFDSTMQALHAGKPVLCEKPMTISHSQCKQVIELAHSKKLLFVEGLWSKFLPAYCKLREELKNNAIGEILLVSIEFGLEFKWDSTEQIADKDLGGGTTLGLGCYAIHFANLVFNCEKPTKIIAAGKLNSSGLDEESQITLIYSKGQVAQISLSTVCAYANSAKIFGTNGSITLPNFWCCEELQCPSGSFTSEFSNTSLITHYPKTVGFVYEIEKVRQALMQKRIQTEEITHEDSLVASEILNEVFHQLGLNYWNIKPIIQVKTVHWGIISTGRIANDFCLAMMSLPENRHKVVAVASRTLTDAKKFAEVYKISRWYDDYLKIASDPEVDIVYIASVSSLHATLSKCFLSAGKAVLCEKPMATSLEDTIEVIKIAKKHKVLFVEGFWSRYFPVYKQLRKILEEQTIGNIRLVHIEFGVQMDWNSSERLRRKDLGGGVTLDIGCYATQLACLIFPNKFPTKVTACGILHEETGVDKQVSITFSYDNHAAVQILVSGMCDLSNSAVIYGTLGKIVVPSPFWCPVELETPLKKFKFDLPETHEKFCYRNSIGLVYEIEAMREAYLCGLTEMPEMTHDDSLTISQIQKEVLSQLGVGFKSLNQSNSLRSSGLEKA